MNRYSYIRKNLKKNITSAEYKIQDAVIALLSENNENISVRTAVERAGVERTTFYAYYDRIEDVYEAIENEAIRDILEFEGDEKLSMFIEHLFSFFAENRKTVKAMIASQNRFSYFEKILNAVKYYLEANSIGEYSTENEMIENMIASLIVIPLLYYAIEERDVDLNVIEDKITLMMKNA